MAALELRIPPVALVIGFGLLMWLPARFLPSLSHGIAGSVLLALALVTAGIAIAMLGVLEFRKARTTVNPTNPDGTSSIVASGIYRWSRNPMYVGFLLVLLGWGVYLANLVAILLVPGFVLYMNRFQIQPEERALENKFGAAYTRYKQGVRRWL